MNDEFVEQLWGIVSREFTQIERDLRTVNPNLKWLAGHWPSGPVYPLSAYASAGLTRPTADSEDVDLSLQVAWDGDLLLVSSDICFSDGQYIVEGDTAREIGGENREKWLTDQVKAASKLFSRHVDLLQDLARS